MNTDRRRLHSESSRDHDDELLLSTLRRKAQLTLEANLVQTSRGALFAAGGHQFRTLWVRDFCFSVPGLIAAGFTEIVEAQIQLFLSHLSPEGMAPRGLDVIDPKLRVLSATALRGLPERVHPRAFDYQRNELRAEYLGEHGTPAFDSGLLLIRATRDFAQATHRAFPISETHLDAIWKFYEPARSPIHPALLHQPAFADWQDSARRQGLVLHTQLLHLQAAEWLEQSGLRNAGRRPSTSEIRDGISRQFAPLASGLRPEFPDAQQVSLDSHALLIRENLLGGSSALWSALQDSPWMTSPGLPIRPHYPRSEVSWTTQAVGLRHYHDGLKWGWIIAESAAICYSQGDRARGDQCLVALAKMEDGRFLSEVFDDRGRFDGIRYRSESPFTWTAAKVLEALALRPSNT